MESRSPRRRRVPRYRRSSLTAVRNRTLCSSVSRTIWTKVGYPLVIGSCCQSVLGKFVLSRQLLTTSSKVTVQLSAVTSTTVQNEPFFGRIQWRSPRSSKPKTRCSLKSSDHSPIHFPQISLALATSHRPLVTASRSGYTLGMKTAVSIPNDLFEGAERLARRTRRSRSRLFSDALREYLTHHSRTT